MTWGLEYNVREIKLVVAQYPSGATVYQIQVANASKKFTVAHQFKGNTQDGDDLVFRPERPLTGIRFVRVETLTSPSWVAWREIFVIRAGE